MDITTFCEFILNTDTFKRWKKTIPKKEVDKFNLILQEQNIQWDSPNIKELIYLLRFIPYNEIKSELNLADHNSFINDLNSFANLPLWVMKSSFVQDNISRFIQQKQIRSKLYQDFSKIKLSKKLVINNEITIQPTNCWIILRTFALEINLCTGAYNDTINDSKQKYMIFRNNKPFGILALYPDLNCFSISGNDNRKFNKKYNDSIMLSLAENNIINEQSLNIGNFDTYMLVNSKDQNEINEWINKKRKLLIKKTEKTKLLNVTL